MNETHYINKTVYFKAVIFSTQKICKQNPTYFEHIGTFHFQSSLLLSSYPGIFKTVEGLGLGRGEGGRKREVARPDQPLHNGRGRDSME